MKKCNENILFTTHNSRLTKAAFTLAETLIVIGIIGVVAALTLPNLNHATGDKEAVTRVKKIYSSLNEAFDRAQAIYGDYDTWFINLDDNESISTRQAKRITEFMKISKDCGYEGKGCFSSAKIKDLRGEVSETYLDGAEVMYAVTTADSMSLNFYASVGVYVDIDGPNKGKNQAGSDIFVFQTDRETNMIYPAGQRNFDSMTDEEKKEATFGTGEMAALWVIQNDNLDYLKADSDGKCPNGKQLNWTTNTSCN